MSSVSLGDHFTFGKLIKFVFPCILMVMVESTYSMVDGFFISNYVGKEALASINLIFPVPMIIGSLGFMFGTGGNALISATLGENKPDLAKKIFTMIIYSIIFLGIVLASYAFVYMDKIAVFLGASDTLIKDSILYGRVLIIAIPFFMLQNAFNNLLITAGKQHFGLIFMIITAVNNSLIDYILVYKLNMGVFGAALATAISYFLGGIMPLAYFLSGKNEVLKFVKTWINFKIIGKACSNGISELVSVVSLSFVTILFNWQLLKLIGQNGVIIYSMILYINFIFISIFLGYSLGSIAVVGYKFGEKNIKELKGILWRSLLFIFIVGCVMSSLAYLKADFIIKIFIKTDLELQAQAVEVLRIYSFVYMFVGFNIFTSAFFTGLNDGETSASISFLRIFILQISAILILPTIIGKNGVWFSTLTAESIAIVISVLFLIVSYKNNFKIVFDDKNGEIKEEKNVSTLNENEKLKEKVENKQDSYEDNEDSEIIIIGC